MELNIKTIRGILTIPQHHSGLLKLKKNQLQLMIFLFVPLLFDNGDNAIRKKKQIESQLNALFAGHMSKKTPNPLQMYKSMSECAQLR